MICKDLDGTLEATHLIDAQIAHLTPRLMSGTTGAIWDEYLGANSDRKVIFENEV